MTAKNNYHCIGRIGKDIGLQYSAKGNALANFSVAVDVYVGNSEYKTMWWNCTAFGRVAERAKEQLGKGEMVTLEGYFQPYEYTGRDGATKSGVNLIVTDFEPYVWKKKGEAAPEAEEAPEADETPCPF